MISKIDISTIHTQTNADIQKYVNKKISQLDKFIPKRIRPNVHAEVKLMQVKSKQKNEYICEVIIHLPGDTIFAKESTINMFAAVDIVEQKLKTQLIKYKELHSARNFRAKALKIRHVIGKIRAYRKSQ